MSERKLTLRRTKGSEQLLSTDTHSNTANYKFTYSVEIAPICKDDLVCIPLKQARSLSNISPLTICTRVGSSFHLLDVNTLQAVEVSSQVYWRIPFSALASTTDLVEFTVLDVEPVGTYRGRWVLADAQVALAGAFRSSGDHANEDMLMDHETAGGTSQILHTRTHLGGILQPGDTAMGYHLTASNFNSDDYATLSADRIPDVILIKKGYPNRRKRARSRAWKLRSIAKEQGEEGETGGGRGVVGRMGGRDQRKVEEDYELFLKDLEEDPELRASVNLYKAKDVKMQDVNTGRKKGGQYGMDVDEARPQSGDGAGVEADDEDAEEEADFPDVQLEELLEDFDEMTLGDGEKTS